MRTRPGFGMLSAVLYAGFLCSPIRAEDKPAVSDAELAKLRHSVDDASRQRRQGQLEVLRSAAQTPQSALHFFYDCIERFEFKSNKKTASDFLKWKVDYEHQTKGLPVGKALQCQLQSIYLERRSDGASEAEKKDLAGQWLSWAERLAAEANELSACQGILAQPLGNSVFFTALDLRAEPAFQAATLSPLQVDGIFNRCILPYTDDARYAAAWEHRLAIQAVIGEKFLLPDEWRRYRALELPALRTAMLVDLLSKNIGSRAKNLRGLHDHIAASASHPQAATWLKSLEEALKSEASAAGAP